MATFLLVLVFVIAALSRVVSRGLELINWAIIGFILVALVVLDIAVVPADIWWEGIRGLFTPARPPSGITATELGGLAGFAALASGLNWYVMNHYRDKGYGMGSRVGYIAGLHRKEVLPSGITFPDDDKNTRLWRRWYRYLLLDMWGVFFVGAFLGMLLPTILMTQAVRVSGETPTTETVPVFVATVLRDEYGGGLFFVAVLIGTLILFSTQLGIFEAMVRNFTDGLNGISPAFRRLVEGDRAPFLVRVHGRVDRGDRASHPAHAADQVDPGIGEHVGPRGVDLPVRADVPQQQATPRRSAGVVAVRDPRVTAVFFGFFFINFVYEFLVGQPLVRF